MIGIILASVSAFFAEFSASTGKYEIEHHKESPYTFFFLNCFISFGVFVILFLISPDQFRFVSASLPIFSANLVANLLQAYFSLQSLVQGERSTTSFLMLSIVPLLLGIDAFLGYTLTIHQIQGVLLITAAFAFICIDKDFKKRGLSYTLASVACGAVSISAYKYNITTYNSVIGNELIMYGTLSLITFVLAHFFTKENPLSFLRKRLFIAQAGARGLSNAIESFAYSFAPTSVIAAAKRTAAMLWAIGSGKNYFHESHIGVKIAAFIALGGGIILLAF